MPRRHFMRCSNCGYNNDNDAKFCEKCGANLGHVPQKASGMSTTNKILIIAVIVLILLVGIVAGMLLTSNAPVNNTTANNTSITVSEPVTTPTTTTSDINSPKLIDSGSTSGTDSTDGPFTFEWKTFEATENNLIIYSTYTAGTRSVKQTNTLKKYDDMRVEIIVEPKASGKSSYDTVTTMFGASTVVDYYWNHLRSNVLMQGPIR